jgi:glycosyltransferase involved in cell wall biosynthesis
MISVLIATRDRAALLSETLHTITCQIDPGQAVEIVVVDNGSVDDTLGVIELAATRSPIPITHLREERPGKSHALNAGVARARGDLLVFTDDDVLADRGWLSAYASAFDSTGADFAAGRILPLWEAAPPRWLSPALYGVLAIPDGGRERLRIAKGVNEAIMPLGANMAVRRHVLDRIGGWNPDLGKLQGTLRTGEDHEFALKMIAAGYEGVYEPRASVQHRVPADRLQLKYFQRWFHDNGIIEARLEEEFPTTDRYVLGVPRYLLRKAAGDAGRLLRGCSTADLKRVIAGELGLLWFAGYVKARFRGVA